MQKYINNEKGASDIIALLVILPLILMLTVYLLLGGLFLLEQNELTTIVNKKLDRAVVEGQFTTTIKNDLIAELEQKGFEKSKIEITITPTAAGDANNTTYITRGNEIAITVIYKKAHAFYKMNSAFSTEDKYYVKTRITGMSEKW